AFRKFSNKDTIKWFEIRGVPLVIQNDNCVFPASQKSQSIIDCLIGETKKSGVKIIKNRGIKEMLQIGTKFELHFLENKDEPLLFDKIIVATGGSSARESYTWLENLDHKIEEPVSSLFTFNMPGEPITELMGIVVKNVLLGVPGTKFKSQGSLLITHWGMSGPAVLKLSSYSARVLNEKDYDFKIQVNWSNEQNIDFVREVLVLISKEHPNKLLSNYKPYALSERLWSFLLKRCSLSESKKWNELGKKGINKLVNVLTNDTYLVKGKTAYKEEFVTCGGISLENIDFNTLQSKVCKNMYFAGEVLDIDGITGGYNLQAAWTTGYIAGKLE
ncbi:MAG: aminoacetone oxidase family FAD-binding enzyme, partial [Spirochaetales bacterium]|nr:aminoacetone oxidase family FAD-binding enzyme [Spirochaetales bacterium]